MSPCLCIYMPLEEHLGCFPVLTIMNKAVQIFVYKILCGHTFSIHLSKFQGVQLLTVW